MKKIISWLDTPYYFNPSVTFKIRISAFFGLFVFLFLYVFKPFYLYSIENILLEYTFCIGLITSICTFFFLFVPAILFKEYFNEDNWTIGKNLLLIIVSLFISGIIIWYTVNIYKNQYNIKSLSLLRFISYTYLVGIIPIVLFIYINEKNVRERRERKAFEINEIKNEKEINISKKLPKKVIINSENRKESITFCVNDLVYVTSQGNYASFFLRVSENELKEKILRVTLTKIINELNEYSNIIKCHKSYIININFINDIYGNARGYLLKLDFISFNIPVSRSFSKQSLQQLIIKSSRSSQIS